MQRTTMLAALAMSVCMSAVAQGEKAAQCEALKPYFGQQTDNILTNYMDDSAEREALAGASEATLKFFADRREASLKAQRLDRQTFPGVANQELFLKVRLALARRYKEFPNPYENLAGMSQADAYDYTMQKRVSASRLARELGYSICLDIE